MRPSRFQCLFAAGFMTVTPYTPGHFLAVAKAQTTLSDKISTLRELIQAFPLDPASRIARDNLSEILAQANDTEEALQVYQETHPAADASDLTLLDYYLKTGRYTDVLRATSRVVDPVRDFPRDERLMELEAQAFLAKGHYSSAHETVDRWLARYAGDGTEGGRYEGDVRSIKFLQHHLAELERMRGPEGKPLLTASAPENLRAWSQKQNVPVVFVKVVPSHPAGQLHEPVLPGRYEDEIDFEQRVDELNRGFGYLSGGTFSLSFGGLQTVYVQEGDMDPASSGAHSLTSRVYINTVPALYRLTGKAFVVLVDYRAGDEGEANYLGDGFIHISASRLQTLVVMHEILHSMGASHQDWTALESQGYQFDPEDRGVMTFEKGRIHDLGLEEKNRILLGWPHVAVVRFADGPQVAALPYSAIEASAAAAASGSPSSENLSETVPSKSAEAPEPSARVRELSRIPI